jgi:hypothetical protein
MKGERMDAEILIEQAKEFAKMARPSAELGIDPWDVPAYCPFHGFVACACMEDNGDVLD